MGETISGPQPKDGAGISDLDPKADGGSKRKTGTKPKPGPGTPNTGSGTSGTTPRTGPGTGAGAGASEAQGSPGVVVLDPENIPKQTNSPKKKKSAKSKKDLEMGELQSNIQVVLMGGFEILSKRAGSHWQISVEESEKIAQPMTRILDRLEISEKLNAYSDYLALTAALAMTVIPRVMISSENNKRKEYPSPVVQEVKPLERETAAGSGKDTQPGPGSLGNLIKESIPGISM